jgi:hypothetical protein
MNMMTREERDFVFTEFGFKYLGEHSHGLGTWYKDCIFIFAKTIGTIEFMILITDDDIEKASGNIDFGVRFNIPNMEAIHSILTYL